MMICQDFFNLPEKEIEKTAAGTCCQKSHIVNSTPTPSKDLKLACNSVMISEFLSFHPLQR